MLFFASRYVTRCEPHARAIPPLLCDAWQRLEWRCEAQSGIVNEPDVLASRSGGRANRGR